MRAVSNGRLVGTASRVIGLGIMLLFLAAVGGFVFSRTRGMAVET